MWCNNCSHETNASLCERCGEKTEPVIPAEIYWCSHCNIPLIKKINDKEKEVCPLCGQATNYLSSDLRPVFPEERLLLEILLDEPLKYKTSSVWANNNRYYINGKTKTITSQYYKKYTPEYINKQLKKYSKENSYDNFNNYIELFRKANKIRLDEIIDEAHKFIINEASKYPLEKIVISFSGGKDSTATEDLAVKALGEPSLVHIFGNTTLEFPSTIAYAERFRKENPLAIFRVAINREQDFMRTNFFTA